MGLDINILRAEKGGNPDAVKESQRRRNPANPDEAVARVDTAIALDEAWRKSKHCFLIFSNWSIILSNVFRYYDKVNCRIYTDTLEFANRDSVAKILTNFKFNAILENIF